MKSHLEITIPDHNAFYSLYADGTLSWKTYDRLKKASLLYYPPGAAVILYYTYPAYREACLVRHSGAGGGVWLPGLSSKRNPHRNLAFQKAPRLGSVYAFKTKPFFCFFELAVDSCSTYRHTV